MNEYVERREGLKRVECVLIVISREMTTGTSKITGQVSEGIT